MTVYALAQLTIHDRTAYGRYQARFMDVLNRFNGRLLASDESPLVLEGTWDREKAVLLAFADQDAFLAWAGSPDYQEIAKDRKAGADAVVLLLKGVS
jgi:uncharacterized protein (DUF1330 family)